MKRRALDLPEIVEITPNRFADERGYFSETFRQDWFEKNVAPMGFVQENQSLTLAQGTIRGLHFQTDPMAQGKLVRCLSGAIFDVAVDIRTGSPSFGRWTSVNLTSEEGNQLWVPPGFLHGFCTLTAKTVVCYKVTSYYSRENDAGVAWNDRDIGVAWPDIADASLLSAKDKALPALKDIPAAFHFSGELV